MKRALKSIARRLCGFLVREVEEQCASLTARCATLTEQCASLTARCATLAAQCATLTERCASLTEQCANLTEQCARLQGQHDALEDRIPRIEARMDNRLKHHEEIFIPAISHFQAKKVAGQPVIFEDVDHLLFECDAMHTYPMFITAKSVVDDPKLVQYLRRAVQPGDTVLDVGANMGGVTILCGKLVGATGRVFAIEAEAQSFELLRRNIARNHMEGRVTAVHAAAYSSEKVLTLNVFEREASAWNTLGWFEQGYAPIATQEVKGITLDAFCSEHAIEKIDLLKVDVEGAEPEVLAGAAGLLGRRAVRRLIFEVSKIPMEGMGHQAEEIVQPLQAAGYALYQIGEDGNVAPVDPETFRATFFGNYVALCEVPTR